MSPRTSVLVMKFANSREKTETWILLFNRGILLLLGHLLRSNYIPFTFAPFYLFRSNRSHLFKFTHCPYLFSEYKIKRICTHGTLPFIQSWDHKIMRPYPKKWGWVYCVFRGVVMEHVKMTNKWSLNFFKYPKTFRLRLCCLYVCMYQNLSQCII